MPLLFQKDLILKAEVGVWNIDEDEDYFLGLMSLQAEEVDQLAQIKGRKRSEWLAVRHLLHIMSGRSERGLCLKDNFGKPYLQGSSYHISMSHTNNMAAVIAGPNLVGIDIQKRVEKIQRISHKFINATERKYFSEMSVEILHIIWGAKECLYKGYGRRQLDFRTNIIISPTRFDKESGKFEGHIIIDNKIIQEYELIYEWIQDEICLVYAVAKEDYA